MINIAIIPARSGSKRLTNKNIKNFCGKPMIYWPIKTIKKSNVFNDIYVSTDSLKIKELVIKYGAKAPFLRPKNISTDNSKTIDVVKHFIKYLDQKKIKYDNVCCFYPTSVFLKKEYIVKAYKNLLKNKHNLIFSAHKIDPRFQRSFLYNKSKEKIKILFNHNIKKKTQDLEDIFVDSAQFYFAKKRFWKKNNEIINNNSSFIELNTNFVTDIDNIDDFKEAIIKFKKNILKR